MRRIGNMGRPAAFSHKVHCTTDRLGWTDLVKRVIARFSRGNIAAQEGRLLLPEEQEEERKRVRAVVQRWRERGDRAA